MTQRRVTVTEPEGLHARPAALLVRLARAQPCAVTIGRPGGRAVPATSLVAVLALGVRAGDDVVLAAEGPGADEALAALAGALAVPGPPTAAGDAAAAGAPRVDTPVAATPGAMPERPALVVRAPLAGRVVALVDVPDPVFARALVGPGVGLDPAHDGEVTVVAPVDGTLVKLHPHAFAVRDAHERTALVHLGIDTVQLGGTGFDLAAREGDAVRAGAAVVRWRPGAVAAGGRSPVCPVVALEAPSAAVTVLPDAGTVVGAGDALLEWR